MKLVRTAYTQSGIFGELFDDLGEFFCFTLERAFDVPYVGYEPKVPNGTYEVVLEYSPRFRRNLYELKGVRGVTEAKFHAGNKHTDSDGCILVGEKLVMSEFTILESLKALEKLHNHWGGAKSFQLTIEDKI